MNVRELGPDDRGWLQRYIRDQWGSEIQAFRGKVVRPAEFPGLVAEDDGAQLGVATLAFDGDECEIVTLNAEPKHRGTGSALVEAVAAHARERGCRRLRVTTTNANLDALRFYMRRGFRLYELRVGAVDRSRELKTGIPETGAYGIPMHDELELEMPL
jgi:GNAT superfamily N-acetyltransferase